MVEILVIDDDTLIRRLLRRQLISAGYEVIEAVNGTEGLALCRERQPTLVITDIFMPETEGIETIVAIRRDFPKIKIVAVSGSGIEKRGLYLGAARKLGADAVLDKPWQIAELKKILVKLLTP